MLKNIRIFISVALALVFTTSCKEDIDDSAFAIATGATVAEYISSQPELSDMEILLKRVKLGNSEQASPVYAVLSARGNYTCFFPKNESLRTYCQQKVGSPDVNLLDDETAELLVMNCIIDNGEENAYESPDFPEKGTFGKACLSQRQLNCLLDENSDYIINSSATVLKADIEATNGFVNIVSAPIAPSMLMVPDIILKADNMKIFGTLLAETHWADSMQIYQDADFNNTEHEETRLFTNVGTFNIEQNRYMGFTAFVETDDVYENQWGIPAPILNEDEKVTNFPEILSALRSHCETVYGTEHADDITHPDNAVNRFVAYHIMKGKYAFNKLYHHFSELGYDYGSYVTAPQEQNYTLDVWDYYPTMGRVRGLLKVLQVPDGEHEVYLNRVHTYETESYHSTGIKNAGVQVLPSNGENDNNALNGYYHPLAGILLYDTETRNNLASERIRFDICDILPEITSNSDRTQGYKGFERGYFENIFNETESTNIYYLTAPKGAAWRDYQGDEFLFSGTYDFMLRLPPVPQSGTYEIRMGVAMNPYRSMAQVYFGSEPSNLQPAGLPYDMRQSANNNPSMPWVADMGDEAVDRENDRQLRTQGYMKAPKYFASNEGGTSAAPARTYGGDWPCMRRIITTAYMDTNKTYYLRFKTALENTDSQFFLDYFELVPSFVYNGPVAEDIW